MRNSLVAFFVGLSLLLAMMVKTPVQALSSTAEIEGVRLISSTTRRGTASHVLGITCAGIPERQATIREKEPRRPIGAVLFTSGGKGTDYYARTSAYAASVVDSLRTARYETFEIKWDGVDGWATGAEGFGYKDSLCGYELVVRWLTANKVSNPTLVCATGNSGGAAQIGYGLSAYNLEDVLDMVVLSGGPPTSRVDVGCFGSTDPSLAPAEWTAGAWGRTLTDDLMGWTGAGDYCVVGSGPTELVIPPTQNTSLASPAEARDYDFPGTKVNFVNATDDETHAEEQGRLYLNQLVGSKAWYEIAGTAHSVQDTSEGSQKITDLLLQECN